MSLGIWQLVLILVIVLLLFGAGKLPRVMGDIGKGVKSLKDGLKEGDPNKVDATIIPPEKSKDKTEQ